MICTFWSSLSILFFRPRGWRGTCFMKVTLSSFLFLLKPPLLSSVLFLFCLSLSRGWWGNCFTNVLLSFVFLANLSLGWTGTYFKNTTSLSAFLVGLLVWFFPCQISVFFNNFLSSNFLEHFYSMKHHWCLYYHYNLLFQCPQYHLY